MRLLLALIALAIASCGARHRQIMGPDGTPHYSITCRRSIENCYREAERVCPGGYSIVNAGGGTSGAIVSPNGFGGVNVARTYEGDMFIKCRDDASYGERESGTHSNSAGAKYGEACRDSTDCRSGLTCRSGACKP